MATDDKSTPAKAAPAKAPTTEAKTSDGPVIDPRLDNRTGDARPPLETYPAKPQQVDGPDITTQAEHTRRALAEREADDVTRKGMFSAGPHGLGDETQRESEPFTDAEVSGAKAAGR